MASFIKPNPATDTEIQAWHDKMKKHYDGYQDGDEQQSDMILMALLTDNFKESDSAFHSKTVGGNALTITADSVGMDVFVSGATDSPENINKALEVTVAAKAFFEEDAAYLSGQYTSEETAVMAYAADLVGFTMLDRPDGIEISPELKAKMDVAWDKMQGDLGIKEAPEVNQKQVLAADPSQGVVPVNNAVG